MKKLIGLLTLLSNVGLSQTVQQPLLVTRIYGVTSSWVGEGSGCPGSVNNTSTVSRSNDYHAISVSGTGSWTAALNFSDTSCTGPWTSFGASSSITQASSPPIAFGYGNHRYIQISITGAGTATYSASKGYFTSAAASGVSFPISWVTQLGSRPVDDIRTYGALCNGSNDIAAFQAAEADSSTRWVYLPPGNDCVANGSLPTMNRIYAGPGKLFLNGGYAGGRETIVVSIKPSQAPSAGDTFGGDTKKEFSSEYFGITSAVKQATPSSYYFQWESYPHLLWHNIVTNGAGGAADGYVNANSASGQPVLCVSHANQFLVGDLLVIGGGTAREEGVSSNRTVTSVADNFTACPTYGRAITLAQNLTFAHTAIQADNISRGNRVFNASYMVDYRSAAGGDNQVFGYRMFGQKEINKGTDHFFGNQTLTFAGGDQTAQANGGYYVFSENVVNNSNGGNYYDIAVIGDIRNMVREPAGDSFVNADSNTATSTLFVADSTKFWIGETIVIGAETLRKESRKVLSIGAGSLGLDSPLTFTHTAVQADKATHDIHTVWIGAYHHSYGSAPADLGIEINGNFKQGIDMAGASLLTQNAILMAPNHMLCFDAIGAPGALAGSTCTTTTSSFMRLNNGFGAGLDQLQLFVDGLNVVDFAKDIVYFNKPIQEASYIVSNFASIKGLGTVQGSWNWIGTESGANNAIAGALVDIQTVAVPLGASVCVRVLLAHTLQAGANTFNFNGGGAVAIKSNRNAANNIATAWTSGGIIPLCYDGTRWRDMTQ